MKVLVIGGTGLISTGIVDALLARGASVTLFNRAQRERAGHAPQLPTIVGNRNVASEFEERLAQQRFDVVIDMICFSAEQAEATVRAFGGRTEQLIFCSTVCTYGVDIPASVLVDETFPQRPTSEYAQNKLACEQVFLRAHAEGQFHTTIVRPSNTYGPGASLIDQMEFDSCVWDRVQSGLPVLCAGDGLGLWQSTHRSDVGRLFAYAAGNPLAYGEAFNATHDRVFTWRDYYREAAAALGTHADLVLAPAGWIIAQKPARFAFLSEITRYHGAYSSKKAKRAVPEFHCDIDFVTGARETFADIKRRGAWREHQNDAEYEVLVRRALGLGFEKLRS
jgi:nucleoside-diphosphate-sugar epimerase